MFPTHRSDPSDWPEIDYSSGAGTAALLRLYSQVVGKVRLVQSPWVNHSWHVPLYVSARGLTTTPIPSGSRVFEMEFDFHDHELVIRCVTGRIETVPLGGSVADFYHEVMAALDRLGYGSRSCRSIGSSRSFVAATSASRARCISSGAVSISR